MQVTTRAEQNSVGWQRMKPQAMAHAARLEKMLVLAFDIITVALTERTDPSGGT